MQGKIYWYDRYLARTLLQLIPQSVTPNQITLVRLLLTPVAIALLALREYDIGVPFFLFLALTDLADGSLARTRGMITEWGIIWDPIADKIMIGSIVLLLLQRGFSITIALTLLGFECAFLLGGWMRKREGVIRGANWWGKIKMVCQVAGVTSYLLFLQTSWPAAQSGSYALFSVAAFLAFCSLLAHGL